MSELRPFLLDDGTEMLVEVEALGAGGRYAHVGAGDGAPREFGAAFDTVKPAVRRMFATLGDMEVAPEEIELQVGVSFSADAGACFAKVGSQANFSVKLKWKPAGGRD